MKNKYEIRGDVVAIFIESLKYGRQETLISATKLETVLKYPNTWFLLYKKRYASFYVIGKIMLSKGKRTSVSLGRWVSGVQPGIIIDHINHDTLDNTDQNLRGVTNAENLQNRKGAAKHSASGIRGVVWHKVTQKWKVQLTINGKKIHIGLFNDIHEAEKAAKQSRLERMPFAN